jgi:hypothetical protein
VGAWSSTARTSFAWIQTGFTLLRTRHGDISHRPAGPTFHASGISRYGRRAVTHPGPVEPAGHTHRSGCHQLFPHPSCQTDACSNDRLWVGYGTRKGVPRSPTKTASTNEDRAVRATAAPRFYGLRHDKPGETSTRPSFAMSASIVVISTTCVERVGRGRNVGPLLCGEASVESGHHRGGDGPCASPSF